MSSSVEKKVRPLKKQAAAFLLNQLIEVGAIDWLGHQFLERLHKLRTVEWSTADACQKYLDLTAQNKRPLLYAGHFVHVDATLLSDAFGQLGKTTQIAGLENVFDRAVITVAASVANGKQDRLMQFFYPFMADYAGRNNTDFLEIVRKKDITEHGMERKPDALKGYLEQNPQAAVGIFPYGSIHAGRHKKEGKRGEMNGLPKLYHSESGEPKADLLVVYDLMNEIQGQEPYFLPVGISRSYQIQNPDTYKPKFLAIISLYDKPAAVLKLMGFKRTMAVVTIGAPITGLDISQNVGTEWKTNLVDTNNFLMEQVARLQLPQERGCYAYVG